ncbi:MAG: hypothetical protein BM563_05915 [Bacteroidetes bacterium MedPE-SWsnd-G1]|nr:MAG: hypothetical protein BM563_05915 [Bacteroidetes bacterium MedPE-SWsnd-G1]
MDKTICERIIAICDAKIDKKGDGVGVSFYAFFENKNNNPEALFKVAKWWIKKEKLDHFEKAVKIKKLVKELDPYN